MGDLAPWAARHAPSVFDELTVETIVLAESEDWSEWSSALGTLARQLPRVGAPEKRVLEDRILQAVERRRMDDDPTRYGVGKVLLDVARGLQSDPNPAITAEALALLIEVQTRAEQIGNLGLRQRLLAQTVPHLGEEPYRRIEHELSPQDRITAVSILGKKADQPATAMGYIREMLALARALPEQLPDRPNFGTSVALCAVWDAMLDLSASNELLDDWFRCLADLELDSLRMDCLRGVFERLGRLEQSRARASFSQALSLVSRIRDPLCLPRLFSFALVGAAGQRWHAEAIAVVEAALAGAGNHSELELLDHAGDLPDLIAVGDAVYALRDAGGSADEEIRFVREVIARVTRAAAQNPQFSEAASRMQRWAERIYARELPQPERDADALLRALRDESWNAAYRVLKDVASEPDAGQRRQRSNACFETVGKLSEASEK